MSISFRVRQAGYASVMRPIATNSRPQFRRHKLTKALMVVSAILVAACATPLKPNQVSVVFDTEPPLAILYGSDGTAWGSAPQTRVWTFKSIEGAKAGATVSVTAVWPSGAKKTQNIRLSGSVQEGAFKISRPIDAPGLAQDLEYVRRIRNQEAAQDAANAAMIRQAFESNKKRSATCTNFGTITHCSED